MLAYLCVVNNRLDDLRFRRIVNNPPRGIGQTTLAKVADLAENQGLSLYEVFRNADLFPELKSVKGKLSKFADLLDELRRKSAEMPLPDFYDLLCDESGYVKMLETKGDEESLERLDNVRELKSSVTNYAERVPEDATLSGFLNETALYTDLDSAEFGDNCVTLMTIHAAKGLEFPVVYVAGMEEGIFPNNNALYEEKGMEEERRLCYVAMTRAKERLVMTNAKMRMLYGETRSNPASRFLEEIPEDVSEWTGKPRKSKYASESSRSYGWNAYGRRAEPSTPTAPAPKTSAASESVKLRLQAGDLVEHTAFGKGIVLGVTPLARDALLEIRFDGPGVKKLMLNSAAERIKKL